MKILSGHLRATDGSTTWIFNYKYKSALLIVCKGSADVLRTETSRLSMVWLSKPLKLGVKDLYNSV